MSNQGFWGALAQYWNVEPKARLHRRNTYFEDHMDVSNYDALKMGLGISVVATAILIFWSLMGLML